ncbi:MAG: alanine--tRNA ligase [Clostridia bacterium]|nr:alanine--tRNA ligase [Clostridia bacterium]
MEKLGLNEIRERYLSFFESKGHLRLPSFPLVPQGDASLLLINAGMAPLKPYFTGKEVPPRKRVTTCQKCIRTPDIECVGLTARHGTFFEMLGNFSFGDYFKKEATAWAWEFITKVLEIPEDRLWVSVYEEDEEAVKIWTEQVGVARDRIVYLGKEDNFWEIGTGPCGPCSEIYFDRGEAFGCGSPDCAVGCDCDRFVEFWNLVFTQFDKDEEGNYNRLANPNIDTGMGLERIACIMQGVTSIFEVDTIRKILDSAAEMVGVTYGKDKQTDISLRVITDHIRSTVFMVSDGILPSNEGRGYVLRRLLRRAARHGRLLGLKEAFLYKLAKVVAGESGDAYPSLKDNFEYIEKVIKTEEQRFEETIDQGINILGEYTEELKKSGKTQLSGENAFKLYDTYGFPIDLTREILAENKMTVNEEEFKALMEDQRERARAARGDMEGEAWKEDIFATIEAATIFDGYENTELSAEILGIGKDGERVDGATDGDEITLVLDRTPFYGESGGQIGDSGVIETKSGAVKVLDTKKLNGKFLHICKVEKGTVNVGDEALCKIDNERRLAIRRNHSSAHLLQAALRHTLGNHVAQAGSYVDEERMRFDFSHFAAMTQEELSAVEAEVNKVIFENLEIECSEKSIDEAKAMGATALFGEKYGERVRVVKMGDYSLELCGGTHASSTGALGLFKIVSESGVAAGVRRIEAVTGMGVLKLLEEKQELILKTAAAFKLKSPAEIAVKAEAVVNENRELERKLEKFNDKMAALRTKNMMASVRHLGAVNVLAAQVDGMGANEMKALADNAKSQMTAGVVVLAANDGGKITFVAMAMPEAVAAGVHCGNIIREVTAICGGKGGGKPDMAQGGGTDPLKIDDALSKVDEIITGMLK